MIVIKMRFGKTGAVFRAHTYKETNSVKDAVEKSVKRIGGVDMQECTGMVIDFVSDKPQVKKRDQSKKAKDKYEVPTE